jgi:DNA polymerase III epsilon subunit-like protein
MYLFFDTETTGLPLNWKAPIDDLANWPRLVQVAWILYEDTGKEISSKDLIIKPEGFIIPAEASRIHGITNAMATRFGTDLFPVLGELEKVMAETEHLVAHNMSFDEKILGAEFLRKGMVNPIDKKNRICTMLASTDFCQIKGRYGNKWPTLAELHQKLFNTGFEDAHNAAADIRVTAKCFWKLKQMEVL